MKYSIGETVRIKATGEKVKIWDITKLGNYFIDYGLGIGIGTTAYSESELKLFCPTRTGKYRNSKGQFISNGHRPTHNMQIIGNWNVCNDCYFRERIDSKQRNYQKILSKLDVLEKKIDKLNHETTYR